MEIKAAPQALTYSADVFNVTTIDEAKQIILTPDSQTGTAERWVRETPYLVSLVEQSVALHSESVVLDYGCGIGRLAKALIDKHGCHVVGVDISPSMRALAAAYVGSDRFLACAPAVLDWLPVQFDASLAVWVLQHCMAVEGDVDRIHRTLRSNGTLFVVNDYRRLVPTREAAWADDGKDLLALLTEKFAAKLACNPLDENLVGKPVAASSYWASIRK